MTFDREAQRPWVRFITSTPGLIVARLLIVAVALGGWQLSADTLVPRFWISRPSDIFALLWRWIIEGSIWPHLLATLSSLAAGYVIGCVIGIAIGLFLGFFPRADRVSAPYIVAAYSTPNIALAPLFIILFGIGLASKIAIVALTVGLLLLYATLDGVRDVDRDLRNALILMGARRDEIARKVLIPAALPWIYNGMRTAIRFAFTAVIVGELISANRGIGYLIAFNAGIFKTTGVFAAITVLVVCCVVLMVILDRTERATSS